MKIYDCTTFYNEHMMYDIRLNILNEKVEKFIVTESIYSHSGQPKKLNFDINNYKKFKDKIIYIVIDREPDDIEELKGNKGFVGPSSLIYHIYPPTEVISTKQIGSFEIEEDEDKGS